MRKFEYETVKFAAEGWFSNGKIDEERFTQILNEMGMKGWELISCFTTNNMDGATRFILAVFKREI